MNIRPYAPQDLERIMALYHDSIHTLAAAHYTSEQLTAWAPLTPDAGRWRARLAGLETLIAGKDGVIAGFAAYGSDGHLDFLFTHPTFARQGVATQLCNRVESRLRLLGVNRIFTEASLAARPFFERRGFVVDVEESVECRGTRLRRFAMHKELEARS